VRLTRLLALVLAALVPLLAGVPARSATESSPIRWTDKTSDAMVDDATGRALAQGAPEPDRAAAVATIAALAGAGNLVVVASSGRGTDSIDVAACTAHGVAVVNNPGLGTIPVSEHAIAMMLAPSRRLNRSGQMLRAGGAWNHRTELDVRDVNGRTLGIVGLGLIGSEMARTGRIAE